MFEVSLTTAVNCEVLPAATLTVGGVTETAIADLFEVPAQPKNSADMQLRLHSTIARDMKVLTGGPESLVLEQESQSGPHRVQLPMQLDYKAA